MCYLLQSARKFVWGKGITASGFYLSKIHFCRFHGDEISLAWRKSRKAMKDGVVWILDVYRTNWFVDF